MAAVEFALILPLLALLCAGLVTLSIALLQLHAVSDSGRQGARISAAVSASTTDCWRLEAIAESEATSFQNRYGVETRILNLLLPWSMPTANILPGRWDGYNFQWLAVNQGNRAGACPLCLLGLNWNIGAAPRAVFLLEDQCF